MRTYQSISIRSRLLLGAACCLVIPQLLLFWAETGPRGTGILTMISVSAWVLFTIAATACFVAVVCITPRVRASRWRVLIAIVITPVVFLTLVVATANLSRVFG